MGNLYCYMGDEANHISTNKLKLEYQARPDLRKSLAEFQRRGRESERKMKSFEEVLQEEMVKGEDDETEKDNARLDD